MLNVKVKLKSNQQINVEGKIGRYTRESYSRDMFKPVDTEYNNSTKNLEVYLSGKVKNARDITKVFRNLENKGYTITTVRTIYNNIPCYNTEIGGIFNGNIRTINVLWQDKVDYYDRGNFIEDGFKQTILFIIH